MIYCEYIFDTTSISTEITGYHFLTIEINSISGNFYLIRGFPVWWTAPNLILNILFHRLFVHRIQKSKPFSRQINSFFSLELCIVDFPYLFENIK